MKRFLQGRSVAMERTSRRETQPLEKHNGAVQRRREDERGQEETVRVKLWYGWGMRKTEQARDMELQKSKAGKRKRKGINERKWETAVMAWSPEEAGSSSNSDSALDCLQDTSAHTQITRLMYTVILTVTALHSQKQTGVTRHSKAYSTYVTAFLTKHLQ